MRQQFYVASFSFSFGARAMRSCVHIQFPASVIVILVSFFVIRLQREQFPQVLWLAPHAVFGGKYRSVVLSMSHYHYSFLV